MAASLLIWFRVSGEPLLRFTVQQLFACASQTSHCRGAAASAGMSVHGLVFSCQRGHPMRGARRSPGQRASRGHPPGFRFMHQAEAAREGRQNPVRTSPRTKSMLLVMRWTAPIDEYIRIGIGRASTAKTYCLPHNPMYAPYTTTLFFGFPQQH